MDPGTLALLAAPLVSAAGVIGWYLRSDDARRTRRVLRKTRVTRVTELQDGLLACVVGVVEAESDARVISMITHQPCIAYDTTVYFFTGHNATVPAKVETERRMVPFLVRDATGVVRIDAAEAALCSRAVAQNERYRERVIVEGMKIRIVGSVHLEHTNTDNERDYRTASGYTATLTGT
ncbi:MAG TPA: hypothetical protein VGC41_21645, partial [Kofleriaceae bacterium]